MAVKASQSPMAVESHPDTWCWSVPRMYIQCIKLHHYEGSESYATDFRSSMDSEMYKMIDNLNLLRITISSHLVSVCLLYDQAELATIPPLVNGHPRYSYFHPNVLPSSS